MGSADARKGRNQGNPAPTDVEIHPLIRQRWSPRAFSDRPVEAETLRVLFEAARWAPSSYNEQPWRFLVATMEAPEWMEQLRSYLSSGNAWAKRAPVLIASAYKTHFSHTGKANRVARRDLGAAEENLFLQAYALGLVMHQMAGFDHERLKQELLPDGFDSGVMTAIGYAGDPEALDESLQKREQRERVRKPLPEFVFGQKWGEAAPFLR